MLALSGRVVLVRQLVAGARPQMLALPPTVPPGVYAVRVSMASGTVVRRLVVE